MEGTKPEGSKPTDWFAELLACPACAGSLSRASAGDLQCAACSRVVPSIDGIPCLFPDPEAWAAEWVAAAEAARVRTERELESIREQRGRGELLPATRERLLRLAQGKQAQLDHVEKLLRPLRRQLAPPSLPAAAHVGAPALDKYLPQLLRDWCWDTDENEAHLAALRSALDDWAPAGPLAVLGAGGGRLGIDLVRALGVREAVLLDINPLLALACQAVLEGGLLELVEQPRVPRGLEAATRSWRSQTAPTLDAEIALVLSDGTRPPFRPGSVDAILTPWFVDVVGQDLRALLPRLNRCLRPGGSWLCFGPLAFLDLPAAYCYTRDELELVAAESGFEIRAIREVEVPYLQSPIATGKRVETVLCLHAVKAREATAPEGLTAPRSRPWLDDPKLPIPASTAIQGMGALGQLYVELASQIDGSRSLSQIATILSTRMAADSQTLQRELARILRGLSGG